MKIEKRLFVLLGLFVILAMAVQSVSAQRGIGDPFGIASRADKPPVSTYSGVIQHVETAPCKSTTGRSFSGTHVTVLTGEGIEFDLHLGPSVDVNPLIRDLGRGAHITFEAFRTDELPEDALVARTITHESGTIVLRDEALRPTWAGGRDRPRMRRGLRY